MKKELKVAFAYLAAIIGAGFASGSETVFYFVRYGNISILGVILTAVGFGAFAFLVSDGCRRYNAYGFDELISVILPYPLKKIVSLLINVFMLVLFGAMIGAFSSVSSFFFDFNSGISAAVFAAVCFAFLAMPESNVIKHTGITGIFIVISICAFCIYLINNRCTDVFSNSYKMTAASLSYISYNTAAVCPMLCRASKSLKKRKNCLTVGILSTFFSFICLVLIWCIVSVYYGKINLGEIPMLVISARQGIIFGYLYAAVITAAVFTSAVASGFGLLTRMGKIKLPHLVKALLVTSASYFVSSIGFSLIVELVYKAIGIALILLPSALIIDFFKSK